MPRAGSSLLRFPNRDGPKDKGEKPAKTDQRCFKCKNIGHVAANCKSAMSIGYFVEKR
uniref:CCHC-type domain-containing protein n=1 Tax=Amphimedon queenslandica TaxID=400682 RepID=A0A1X7TYB2_AMPQE